MTGRLTVRKRVQWLGLAIAILLASAGCSAPLQYVQSSPRTFPPRGQSSNVRVFYVEPVEPYDVLGTIRWDNYQPGLMAYQVIDIMPRLKQKAWELGGDALIVRKHVIDSALTRSLQIIADVIRFN